MNAIAFDTLAYVKRLRDAGFEPEQAEAQAEALVFAIGDSLATSEELHTVEANLRKDIGDLRMEIRAEIREANRALIKWLVPMLIGQTAVVAALVKLL
jgi:hypothetical protein